MVHELHLVEALGVVYESYTTMQSRCSRSMVGYYLDFEYAPNHIV